jgi:UDP-N-acetylmuramate: L-alanyl-gamma-D-glutamyl-meso-diaminopimelate ligase
VRVHLVGVSGAGMGSLAVLLRAVGHEVSGSDVAFDPPIGPALAAAGVRCLEGWDAAHLDATSPELVVVGNVVRQGNPEAAAAEARGIARTSMSRALRDQFLVGRKPLVVAGTHGKTTTASMCAHVLSRSDREPGWFIGGVPRDLPAGAAIGSTKRRLTGGSAERAPFVVEGDEYDDVYWSKRPKFLDYVGVGPDDVAIVTSVEQDHIDIYPSVAAYEEAFRAFVRALPAGGLVVVDAHAARARAIAAEESRAKVVFYALEGDDTGDVTPTWLGAVAAPDAAGNTQFDLFAGGMSCGRYALRVPGAHNVRNAVATIAACAEGFGVDVRGTRAALATFEGVKRRQELLGEPGGVRVYDDFAHHPTAVAETLAALRARHPAGTLWAVFEPRSATACRALHQAEYARAFDAADRVLLAPLGRSNIPEAERLDLARLVRDLGAGKGTAAVNVDAIVSALAEDARAGDTIAVLSNGAFGGLHARLLSALEARHAARSGGA